MIEVLEAKITEMRWQIKDNKNGIIPNMTFVEIFGEANLFELNYICIIFIILHQKKYCDHLAVQFEEHS